MMRLRRKRTLKAYMELYHNPGSMFPESSFVPATDANAARLRKGRGPADVILFPNGRPEIWITDGKGKGFRITASRGPKGLGLQIARFAGSPVMTLSANGQKAEDVLKAFDATDLEICQYDDDPAAQLYKAWYAGKAEYPKECGCPTRVHCGAEFKHKACQTCEDCGSATPATCQGEVS